MDWQLLLVLIAVAVAVGHVARRTWRTWAGRGCAGDCGCKRPPKEPATDVTIVPAESIMLRRRSGP